jgi:hypothetical protein
MRLLMSRWALGVCVFLLGSNAVARKFDFKSEYFASYFRGTGGTSAVGDNAFKGAGGHSTEYTDSVKYNFSGEIGFLINPVDKVTLRLGVELLQAKPLNDTKGTQNEQDMFTLTSTVFVFNPLVTVEAAFLTTSKSRAFVYAGSGLANVTMDNQYSFTPLGQTSLGVASDYTEKTEANLIYWHLGLGYEVLFVDNVTAAFDLGYRYLPIEELKYKADIDDMVDSIGSVNKGDVVMNQEGGPRTLDMSGPYIGLSFRFYIELI